MIRKLLLSTAAVALLGGCMTSGYGYRQDRGDYYYGQPSTDYRYYGSPYGYPGGYSRYPYGSPYYGGYYGSPYYNPYHNPYFGHPHYPRPPRPPVVVVPGNPPPPAQPPADDRNDDRRPPWRNLDPRVHQNPPPGPGQIAPTRAVAPIPQPTRNPTPRARDDGGSRAEQVMRRARQRAVSGGEQLD